MNPVPVTLPSLNANDDVATLVKWLKQDGHAVQEGEVMALAETTKTVVEILSPAEGFCRLLVAEGSSVRTGTNLAWITEQADSTLPVPSSSADDKPAVGQRGWTRKAEMVAKKLGVDIEALAARLQRTVNEADVVASQSPEMSASVLVDDVHPLGRRVRVLLIGGGGGGGALAIDAIMRTTHQRAVGILDNNPALHGKTQFGVPILGGNARASELWKAGLFDAAIVLVTADVGQRERLFLELKELGIPLTNVIDPSTQIRASVRMGVGNLIMANCFLSTCVSIGDNNFLASHVCIEHHTKIGSHCTFGPRTTTSGAVTIEDRVKFGMGVLVEPYLSIGHDALIPSGCVLVTSVPASHVVKAQSTLSIKPR